MAAKRDRVHRHAIGKEDKIHHYMISNKDTFNYVCKRLEIIKNNLADGRCNKDTAVELEILKDTLFNLERH